MVCPKCGHEQSDSTQCSSCGIYFAKFHAPGKPAGPSSRRARDVPAEPGFGAGALIVTALLTGALVYNFMRRQATAPPAAPQVAPMVAAADPTTATPASTQPLAGTNSAPVAAALHARNPIEAARNATVFIRTGWGLGSGFIIDEECHVITNRHVVETDGARVADEAVRNPEMQSRIADLQQRLQQSIEREQLLRRALVGRPGTNLEQVELERHIASMRQELTNLQGRVKEFISRKVEGSGQNGFSATLVDGREFTALHAEYASNVDLALFQLPTTHCPYIPAGHSRSLAFGERLYTVGNPQGLAYTVTSGVFSGERGDGQERLLQTDAPINPGNSGGPLITASGQVVGINTMIARGMQGIGFAIPIEAAYEEFFQLR